MVNTEQGKEKAALFLYEYLQRKGVSLSLEDFKLKLAEAVKKVVEKYSRNASIHNWDFFIIVHLLSSIDVQIAGKELETLFKGYEDAFVSGVSLYHDASVLLGFLKGKNVKTGVVIDGTIQREKAIISKLSLENSFNVVVISEEVGANKFSDIPLRKAIEKIGASPEEIAVVGDRLDKDIIPANKLGGVSVLLQRDAAAPVTGKERPKYIIKDLREVIDVLPLSL